MGGPIALEMARMLSCDGAEVARLAVISSDLDDPVPAAYGHGAALVLDAFAVGTDLTVADLQGLPIDKQLALALERAARVAPTGRHIFTVREARQLFDMGQRHARALLDYRPARYAGDGAPRTRLEVAM
jgi:thioesterase domain-containing protein